jgi:hypothetical protein
LWHERRGGTEPGADKPQLTWGTLLEPVIVQHFEDEHPEYMVDYQPGAVWAHPDRPWQVASPDALLTDRPRLVSGLEAKTARYDYDWQEGPPPYYEVQAQWCMDVFDVPNWHFAVLFGGSDYREFEVTANPALQELMRETASDFLDSLTEGRVPPVDDHDSTYQAIRELHPDIEDEDVEVGALGRLYIDTMRTSEAADAAYREAKSLLADRMGNARRALMDWQRIAYRQNSATKPFLKAVPGLLTKYPEPVAAEAS